jgi:beta-lactamase regulating signal transducer with metallopeptidase domain
MTTMASPASSTDWSLLLSGRALGVVWVAGTVVVLLLVLRSVRVLGRERGRWRPAVVEGVPVLVSGEIGPAALGVLRGAIVVPEWALALEGRFRRMLLLHEAEHLRAGDPRLLFAGLLAVAAMPWNPVLWWQFRQLRQALELDCDRRVLRSEPDPRAYGLLLLEVGRRRSHAGVVLAAGLAESGTFLERRIRMLSGTNHQGESRRGRARVRLLGGVVAAALLVVLACEARGPTALEEPAGAAEGAPLASDANAGMTMEGAVAAGLARHGTAAGRSCEPLYILDGVVVEPRAGAGSALSGLEPARIERVEVIKGGAAQRAFAGHPAEAVACGVVQITSKKGGGAPAAEAASAPTRTADLLVRRR